MVQGSFAPSSARTLALALIATYACAEVPPEAPSPPGAPTAVTQASPGRHQAAAEAALERNLDSVPRELRERLGEAKLLRMRDWLNSQYDYVDVRRTLKQRGDTIDCIDFYKQPNLRNKPRAPVPVPPPPLGPRTPSGDEVACPLGTVPIRRVSLTELARLGSVEALTQKP
jgi:hypothetical protein